jgi:hypothetical protein
MSYPPTSMQDIYDEEDQIEVDPTGLTPPRSKCCGVCVFRKDDPHGVQAVPELWDEFVQECREGMSFYCLHERSAAGYHQLCAGAHANFQAWLQGRG